MGLCVGWILLRPRKEQKYRQASWIAYALCVYGSNSLESCACSYGILQSIVPRTGAPQRDAVEVWKVLCGETQRLEEQYCSTQKADISQLYSSLNCGPSSWLDLSITKHTVSHGWFTEICTSASSTHRQSLESLHFSELHLCKLLNILSQPAWEKPPVRSYNSLVLF